MVFSLLTNCEPLMTIKLKSTVDYLLIWDRVDLVRMVILILICSKMLEIGQMKDFVLTQIGHTIRIASITGDCIGPGCSVTLHKRDLIEKRTPQNLSLLMPFRCSDTYLDWTIFSKENFCAVLPVWLYNFFKVWNTVFQILYHTV